MALAGRATQCQKWHAPIHFAMLVVLFSITRVQSLDNASDRAIRKLDTQIDKNEWPTDSSGIEKFLDTTAGPLVSGLVIFTVAAVALVGGLVIFRHTVRDQSPEKFSTGFSLFEVVSLLDQAQFCALLAQLQTFPTPRFYFEYCLQLSWTHFNLNSGGFWDQNSSGMERYALALGIDPDQFLEVTLVTVALALVTVVLLYAIFSCIASRARKGKHGVAEALGMRTVSFVIQLLLIAQFILSAAASYEMISVVHNLDVRHGMWLPILVLSSCGALVAFGSLQVYRHQKEIDGRRVSHDVANRVRKKYAPFYADFNFDNRYFFVPKTIMHIVSGVVVGTVEGQFWQIGALGAIYLAYAMFLIRRRPFEKKPNDFISIGCIFVRIVVLTLVGVMASGTEVASDGANTLAYVILAMNTLVFFALISLTLYRLVSAMASWHKSRSPQARSGREPQETPHLPECLTPDAARGREYHVDTSLSFHSLQSPTARNSLRSRLDEMEARLHDRAGEQPNRDNGHAAEITDQTYSGRTVVTRAYAPQTEVEHYQSDMTSTTSEGSHQTVADNSQGLQQGERRSAFGLQEFLSWMDGQRGVDREIGSEERQIGHETPSSPDMGSSQNAWTATAVTVDVDGDVEHHGATTGAPLVSIETADGCAVATFISETDRLQSNTRFTYVESAEAVQGNYERRLSL